MAKTIQQLEAEKRAAQERKDALYAQYKIDQKVARENARFEENLTPAQQRQLVKEQTRDSYNAYQAAQSAAADADWEVEKAQSLAADQAEFGPGATYQSTGGGTSNVFRQNTTGNTQQITGSDPNNQPYVPDPPAAEPKIPFVSDEYYLSPEYDETITLTRENTPAIPYVSDEEFLYGDDPLYEPVPTDAELASIQERMDEDAEFAAIDEEFRRVDEINDPAIMTAEEENYITSGQEFEEFESDPIIEPPKSIRDSRRPINKGDWRFRVRLSPFSNYLYNAPGAADILAPLKETDGVIFPYTPRIDQTYMAMYDEYNLTHSNYRGYFYQGSQNGDIIVNSMFTAQDTAEANYMLAVIHFFRSATKMFYGQDVERGTPPPLMYLSGMGEYQFNEHPCVLSIFNYNLPDDVDYIKCSAAGNAQTTQFQGRTAAGAGYQSWSSKLTRLISSGLDAGAPPVINNFSPDLQGITNIIGGETYVPTRINIALTFKPVQTRKQVSEEFSLKDYASGKLIKKGFW